MARRRKLHSHKKGGGKGYNRRSIRRRDPGERFLIVCEGEKTEPYYFENFHLPGLINVDAQGYGVSPPKLVERALALRRQSSRRRGRDTYDQVWCVFDKDDWNERDFDSAIRRAESQGLRVAYSNQAFEIWYLLHFHFYNSPMHRKDYENKLSELLDCPYDKSSPGMYGRLRFQQETAIKNARRLLALYPNPQPAVDNPSTTVHILVEELNRFLPENRRNTA